CRRRGTVMNIAEDILDIIGRSEVEGNALKLPAVQLDRKTYLEVDKVLSAIGGKWDRKARAHLFDEPAADAIEQVLLTGTYERTKQDFGQFDSPSAVVGRVIELARIEDGMKVLEPSCGIGRIVAEA